MSKTVFISPTGKAKLLPGKELSGVDKAWTISQVIKEGKRPLSAITINIPREKCLKSKEFLEKRGFKVEIEGV